MTAMCPLVYMFGSATKRNAFWPPRGCLMEIEEKREGLD